MGQPFCPGHTYGIGPVLLPLLLIMLTFLNIVSQWRGPKMQPTAWVYIAPLIPEAYKKPMKYRYLHYVHTAVIPMVSALEGFLCIFIYMSLRSLDSYLLQCFQALVHSQCISQCSGSKTAKIIHFKTVEELVQVDNAIILHRSVIIFHKIGIVPPTIPPPPPQATVKCIHVTMFLLLRQ